MPRSDNALVGRRSELAEAAAVVAAAVGGAPGAVVIDGDAGVGKTRLITELVAGSGDVLVLVGHCVDLGDAPPAYLPLAEAFARLTFEQTDSLLARFPLIGRLLPGKGDRADDRIDRGTMLDTVFAALQALAEQQPVLLVIEDLHWADMATRDLLGFLFTRIADLPGTRLAVLASVRSDDLHRRHPLRAALATWSRLVAVHRLHLDPLPAHDVRELVRALDAEIDETALADIVRRADGNAFFAEELLDTTHQEGGVLPWALADLLLVRLDPLGPDAREAVRVAAVAGRSVAHELLSDVVGLPGDRVDAALREAVDAHVLQAAADSSGHAGYRFRHALLGEAVYDDLLPGERVRIHAAYAARLQEQDDVRAAELARHARAAHDLPVAYGAAVCAGEQALAVGAPFEAVKHLQAALELYGELAEPPGGHVQLVLSFVDACIACGRSRRALRIVRLELSQLPDDAPASDRAPLLYAFAKASMAGEFDVETTTALADVMRLTQDDPPSAFRAQVISLYARMAASMGRDTEAQRTAGLAVEIATAAGARPALAEAESTLATVEQRFGDPDRAAEHLERAATEAHAAGDYGTEVRTRFVRASVFHEQGTLLAAQEAFESAWQRGCEHGRPWDVYSVHCRSMTGWLRYARGHWDDALAVLDISRETPPPVSAAILESTSLFVRAGRGESDAVNRAAVLRSQWLYEGRIALNCVFATVPLLGRQHRVDEAVALADELVAEVGRLWMNPWFLARIELSAVVVDALARSADAAGETRRAELVSLGHRFLDDGRECAERGEHGGAKGRTLGAEARAWLARLEASWASLRWVAGTDSPAEGDLLAAWRAAEAATDYDENVVELARVRTSLAGVLRATGRREDAVEVADLARPVGRATGDVLVLDGLRALSTPLSAGSSGGPSLTPREHEVLGLVAEGRSNRQIAARLYISEKTVSVHVSNILAKLGVQGRTEAAATARRDGLLG